MAEILLHTQLRRLRLSGMLETVEARLRQAGDERWGYTDFLERLLNDESDARAQQQLAKRLQRANLHPDKTIERFDFSFNPQINRGLILELSTCQFVARHAPVLIVGPTGTGKTHLAQALAHQACLKGYDTVYVNTATMLVGLALAKLKGTYARKLKRLVRLPVLVLDDFGLKPLRNTDAEVFYDVIAGRYESGATIITSNHALDEWPTLFGDPLLASSGLDRLFHNAYVITITGASFRARNRNLASAADPSAKASKTAGSGSKGVTV